MNRGGQRSSSATQQSSGERTRLTCWSRRPVATNFLGACEDEMPALARRPLAGSSFRRDAKTSARDARAPRNPSRAG